MSAPEQHAGEEIDCLLGRAGWAVQSLAEAAFVSQHLALLEFNQPTAAPFVFHWIVSPSNGRKILESWAYGAGKPGLSLEQVRSLLVALPPLSEQHRIVAEVDCRLSLVRGSSQ